MLTVNLQTDTLTPALKAVEAALGDLAPAMDLVGSGIVSRIQEDVFFAGKSPYGVPWEPVQRGGRPLLQTGENLLGTITHSFTKTSTSVGTNSDIAPIHQFGSSGLPGGVIRPKNAKALAIPITPSARNISPRNFGAELNMIWKKGETSGVLLDESGVAQYVLVRQVKIEARPFFPLDGLPPDWIDEINDVLLGHLKRSSG